MNILLTNDDGFAAPGLQAAVAALHTLGTVYVAAPKTECSACGHRISLRGTIGVQRSEMDKAKALFIVDGSPADCVRLALAELVREPINLVVSGVNAGANSGVDVYYSGTVAGAREGAILGKPAIAVSQALRSPLVPDWNEVARITAFLIPEILREPLVGRGFWNVNLPAPIPSDAQKRVFRVPLEPMPPAAQFERHDREDGGIHYRDGSSYWTRSTTAPTDYAVIRDGGIAVTAIPLFGSF